MTREPIRCVAESRRNRARTRTTSRRSYFTRGRTRRRRKMGRRATTKPRVEATQNVSFRKNGARENIVATRRANVSSRRIRRARRKAPKQPARANVHPENRVTASIGPPPTIDADAKKNGIALGYESAYSPK